MVQYHTVSRSSGRLTVMGLLSHCAFSGVPVSLPVCKLPDRLRYCRTTFE